VVLVALGEPLNGVVNVGGPAKISFAELAQAAAPDKTVVVDPQAAYFGTLLAESSLVVTD
jgi:hypothetical protein